MTTTPPPSTPEALFAVQQAARWRTAQSAARGRPALLGRLHGAVRAHRAALAEGRVSSRRLTYPPSGRPLLRVVTWALHTLERQTGPRG